MSGTKSDWVIFDWHDGPVLSAATVDFDDAVGYRRLIEVRSLGWVEHNGEELQIPTFSDVFLRLSREDLVKMLDMYDGKPVKDYHEE